ncbi:hypothetical protein HK100_003948 [Physocladia obscura]|uniref:Uncharacterized protein n=1 Tax=Physocladia obscura TaxID=109957 RepID=A0AAD5XL23_9FUNG|nr:hypothetical protein HK100_003948 [Physocladia obscura]
MLNSSVAQPQHPQKRKDTDSDDEYEYKNKSEESHKLTHRNKRPCSDTPVDVISEHDNSSILGSSAVAGNQIIKSSLIGASVTEKLQLNSLLLRPGQENVLNNNASSLEVGKHEEEEEEEQLADQICDLLGISNVVGEFNQELINPEDADTIVFPVSFKPERDFFLAHKLAVMAPLPSDQEAEDSDNEGEENDRFGNDSLQIEPQLVSESLSPPHSPVSRMHAPVSQQRNSLDRNNTVSGNNSNNNLLNGSQSVVDDEIQQSSSQIATPINQIHSSGFPGLTPEDSAVRAATVRSVVHESAARIESPATFRRFNIKSHNGLFF